MVDCSVGPKWPLSRPFGCGGGGACKVLTTVLLGFVGLCDVFWKVCVTSFGYWSFSGEQDSLCFCCFIFLEEYEFRQSWTG